MADYYVDFSASNDGDGSAYTQAGSPGATGAYNTLQSKTFTSGDKVWIRRVVRGSDYSGDVTFANAGVLYIGWPISGDAYYSTRPSGAQGTWDADSATYATFSFNSSSDELNITANNVEAYRIKVNQKATNADALFISSSNTGFKAYSCYFQNSHASGITSQSFIILSTGSNDVAFRKCTFDVGVWNPTSGNGIVQIAALRTIVEECTFTVTTCTPTSSSGGFIYISNTDSYIVNNTMTVATFAGGAGFGVINITSAGTNTVVLNNTMTVTSHNATASAPALTVGANGCVIKGFNANMGNGVSITGMANNIEISSLTQRHANTSGSIQISSGQHGNEVSLVNITFVSGNTTGDIVLNGEGNTVYIRNCAFAGTPVTFSTGTTNKYYSYDHNQTLGNFQYGTKGGTVTSSNTYRSGGESFSLKHQMTGNSLWSRGEMNISRRGAETIWLALSSGARTVTIYGAYKNYTALYANHIWAEAEYVNGSNVVVTATTYSMNAALTSDSSTWNNDSGLTAFKLELTFTLPSDQVVPIRLFGTKYESGAYVYLDPKPVIT